MDRFNLLACDHEWRCVLSAGSQPSALYWQQRSLQPSVAFFPRSGEDEAMEREQ